MPDMMLKVPEESEIIERNPWRVRPRSMNLRTLTVREDTGHREKAACAFLSHLYSPHFFLGSIRAVIECRGFAHRATLQNKGVYNRENYPLRWSVSVPCLLMLGVNRIQDTYSQHTIIWICKRISLLKILDFHLKNIILLHYFCLTQTSYWHFLAWGICISTMSLLEIAFLGIFQCETSASIQGVPDQLYP